MAEVSVIVPVYRVEEYLDRCVQSVLHQSFRDLELILVDDGSPDSCPAMCDGYAREDLRVHVIHQKNGGLSAARNAGIDWAMDHSDSVWLFFLDSDDWLHRDCLLRLRTAAGEHQADVSVCRYVSVQKKTEDAPQGPVSPVILEPENSYVEYYGECMTACCKLIRKELFKALRFPEGKLHEDAFITHRLIFGSRKVSILREPLYYYYFNPGSITRKTWKPKRLEEIEAHEVRLQYLKEHGYFRAEKAEMQVLAQTVYEHARAIAELPERRSYREIFRSLRRRLGRELLAGRKQGLFPVNEETKWLWLMAFGGRAVWLFLQKTEAVLQDLTAEK